jgi:hypothetical protein
MPEEIKNDGIDHDQRVREIQDEIKQIGKDTKSREEWKEYFKSKGYSDDECDLGYVLVDAKINYGPIPPIVSIVLILFLELLFSYLLYTKISFKEDDLLVKIILILVILFAPIGIYFSFLIEQFKKITLSLLSDDFNAMDFSTDIFQEIKSDLFRHKGSKFLNLIKCGYDNRDTYFGDFLYVVDQSGKSQESHDYFVIIQKIKKIFPDIHCFRKMLLLPAAIVNSLSNVTLEGDFNKEFKVYSKDPKDAFYVLNPRLMDGLCSREVFQDIRVFETTGNYIVIAFKKLKLSKISFSEPIIQFGNYMDVKSKILKYLDIVNDLSDIISREIVDSGEKRSEAKNIG